jgi:hypothetical protein
MKKNDFTIKISKTMEELGIPKITLDSIVPPKNTIDWNKLDYSLYMSRLLIKRSKEKSQAKILEAMAA